ACCIGPLVLGALGLGTLGVSAMLAPLRPWFLGLTAVFLMIGFYFAYRPVRKESCSDGSCARPQSRRNQRIALWVMTALAMSFATFPSWGARVIGASGGTSGAGAPTALVKLHVTGMDGAA